MRLTLDKRYYAGTNLRPWSIHQAIQDRVNRESEAMYPHIPAAPRGAIISPLKKSVGLQNFYRGIIKFAMEFRP